MSYLTWLQTHVAVVSVPFQFEEVQWPRVEKKERKGGLDMMDATCAHRVTDVCVCVSEQKTQWKPQVPKSNR